MARLARPLAPEYPLSGYQVGGRRAPAADARAARQTAEARAKMSMVFPQFPVPPQFEVLDDGREHGTWVSSVVWMVRPPAFAGASPTMAAKDFGDSSGPPRSRARHADTQGVLGCQAGPS